MNETFTIDLLPFKFFENIVLKGVFAKHERLEVIYIEFNSMPAHNSFREIRKWVFFKTKFSNFSSFLYG